MKLILIRGKKNRMLPRMITKHSIHINFLWMFFFITSNFPLIWIRNCEFVEFNLCTDIFFIQITHRTFSFKSHFKNKSKSTVLIWIILCTLIATNCCLGHLIWAVKYNHMTALTSGNTVLHWQPQCVNVWKIELERLKISAFVWPNETVVRSL